MISIPFIRGPYDGVSISVSSNRMPDQIQLSVECVDADFNDPSFQKAIGTNLTPIELDGVIVARNLNAIIARYELESDVDGAPFYGYAGWLARAVSEEHGDQLS